MCLFFLASGFPVLSLRICSSSTCLPLFSDILPKYVGAHVVWFFFVCACLNIVYTHTSKLVCMDVHAFVHVHVFVLTRYCCHHCSQCSGHRFKEIKS